MPDLHASIAHLERPARIRRLPIDARGFPVPYFVAIVNGQPDHRLVDAPKIGPAIREKRCWICGDQLGRHLAFLIGPMCAVTRTVSEPPSHRDCAEYAARACPFLTRPHAHRRDAGLPEETQNAPGIQIMRNPGVMCLWMTRGFRPFNAPEGGVLFHVGDPTEYTWYCEGRPATRAEVLTSLELGLPTLQQQAQLDGPAAERELSMQIAAARQYLPLKEDARGALLVS